MGKLGGKGGLPFFAFLDSGSRLIVTSNRPADGKPAFLESPEEVAWFMAMLNKAVPSLTPQEARVIEGQIHKQFELARHG
jgi:hypothetical protein